MAALPQDLHLKKPSLEIEVRHLDVKHLESISNDTGDSFSLTPEKGRHLIRRIDLRLLPTLCILYALAYMDRTNISNAKIAGMEDDLVLTGNRYNIILLAFFPAYIIFEIPSNAILRRAGVARWLGFLVVGWGVVSMCSGFVTHWQQLIGLRFLIGAFEAGFAPGAVYLISSWYTRYETQKRVSVFYIGGIMLSGFNGLLSYGLSEMEGLGGVRGWSWVLIFPGALTILFALPLYLFISDFPEKAKWLKPHERHFFHNRLLQDRGEEVEKPGWKHILSAGADWKVWLLGSFLAFPTMGGYALAFFSPTIIRDLGYNTALSLCLTSPPFIAATISALITGWAADKAQRRLPFLIGNSLLAIVGFLLMAWGPNNGSKLTGIFFGVIGVQTSIPTAITFLLNNVPGGGKRAFSACVMTMEGGIGGIVGSLVFRSQDAPHYRPGLYVSMGSMALSIVLGIFLWIYFRRENLKADREGKVLEGIPGYRWTL